MSVYEESNFLSYDLAQRIRQEHQTPVFVYDEKMLKTQAAATLAFPNPYGITVRFAMKACPNAAILQLFSGMGLHFDLSSGFEVHRAMIAGIAADKLSLSSQELPTDFKELFERGIKFNACSLHQLETFGKLFPGKACGVRFNPGTGSGGTGKTNVGGPSSSFGIWHELKEDVMKIAEEYGIAIERVHTHIGSGSDPAVWQAVSAMSLSLVEHFPRAHTINLGGGYKVGRMSFEKAASTHLPTVGAPIKKALEDFAARTGRELRLEIEPGTFLTANAGVLLTSVQDIVSTGPGQGKEGQGQGQGQGHTFLKLDSGMTEVLRPSLYGAQHPIVVHQPAVSAVSAVSAGSTTGTGTTNYIVVGHCCESGDLFSCKPGDAETLGERELPTSSIGGLVSIEGAGAYCSSMNTKNYNSFPEAPEVILSECGHVHLIRRRQDMTQMLANELPYKG